MKTKHKILFLDIETSPMLLWAWRCGWNLDIQTHQIIEDSKIICVSVKWAGDKKIYNFDWDVDKQDDTGLLLNVHDFISQASIVVGHNIDKFDLPILRTRMLKLGIPPINLAKTVDTLKLCRGNFKLQSNKLDFLTKELGGKGKVDTGGFQLWLDVWLNKSQKALDKMNKYCNNDVKILEDDFWKILPYVDKVPKNLRDILDGDHDCPACLSSDVIKQGFRHRKTGSYQQYVCNNCGHMHVDDKKVKNKC